MDARIKDLIWTALPAAVLYFSGTVYISTYLSGFGIDWTEVELSIQEVLVLSFSVISYPVVAILISTISVLLIVATIDMRGDPKLFRRVKSRIGRGSASVLIVLMGFAFIYLSGKAVGNARVADVWEGRRAKYIMTISELSVKSISDPRVEESVRICLSRHNSTLIFSDGVRTYVLCRSPVRKNQSGVVYTIVNEQISGIRVVER